LRKITSRYEPCEEFISDVLLCGQRRLLLFYGTGLGAQQEQDEHMTLKAVRLDLEQSKALESCGKRRPPCPAVYP
jgi:hypothetical protein